MPELTKAETDMLLVAVEFGNTPVSQPNLPTAQSLESKGLATVKPDKLIDWHIITPTEKGIALLNEVAK